VLKALPKIPVIKEIINAKKQTAWWGLF
jgi:hypothetical protein